jgi:hypothetical protein
MLASWRMMAMAGAGILIFAGATYADSDWLAGKTEDQLKTLANIQPGLGTVMMEYAARWTNTYYAAKGGNWDLAAYMIKEALEIQEVGETTRPKRAGALKAFESAYVTPLSEAIKSKDFGKFDTAFKAGVKGCNGCHVSQGFPYIEYELPASPPAPLKFAP